MGNNKIPCVYVGSTPLRLSADHGPFFDGDGKPLKTMDVLPGQTLMMGEEEVNGMTIWHDPRHVLPSEKLGVGRVVKAEHADLDMDTLLALGYEFHDGRSDFLTIEQAKQKADDEKKATQSADEQAKQRAQDATPKVATATPTPAPVTAIPVPPPAPAIPAPTTPSQGNSASGNKSEVKE